MPKDYRTDPESFIKRREESLSNTLSKLESKPLDMFGLAVRGGAGDQCPDDACTFDWECGFEAHLHHCKCDNGGTDVCKTPT
jgi:hypothetical protein